MAALDVKDTFFLVTLQEKDKEKFAFRWGGVQYTFNRLPQGYKHSPMIAHAALAELEGVRLSKRCESVPIYR